ncbi:transglutaminase family protein [Telmatobacter sp. DSM 110680]|uniref:Transglutaminase family protein n=1 Tax=Telmatobacter sp. DSM 110680 TaxID=3036704 RepID=A0AAU7DHK7_9BACT
MGIQVALKHRTYYRYDQAVLLGPQIIRLRPSLHCRTRILSYSLDVSPAEHSLRWQLDSSSNQQAHILFSQKTSEFAVEVNLAADLSTLNPFDFLLDPGVENYPFQYSTEIARDLYPYLQVDPPSPLLRDFVESCRDQQTTTVNFLLLINRKVRDEVGYVTRLEHGTQTSEETLQKRSGSCRDSAWLLVECLRNLGIAARFVSGYLIQLAEAKTERNSLDSGPQSDSADLHAWAEAFLPGGGWIGLDPTSGLLAGEGHIPLACTSSPAQAAPISGTAEKVSIDFTYAMSVRRLNEARPLSLGDAEDEWIRIRQVAHRVDADLEANDVRLTMGGEPTYVGIDEPESPQWNIDALGEIKRTRGLDLIQALREKMVPGGLLHYGQGKWYPGEPLPRWALSCFWRADGIPVWGDVKLIAQENHDYGIKAGDTLRFMRALSRRLQVSPENILPAFEPDEPAANPAGYILPLRRRQPHGVLRWSSQFWFPAVESIILLSGDSPIGFRIPTEVVPWVAPDELEYTFDEAPFARYVKLPAERICRMELFEANPEADPLPSVLCRNEDAQELIRPALCVQIRDFRLHVSLPYAPILADYLELVSAVEDTCRYLQTPVWIEGYAPGADPRLRSFSVTPDPGVLEVNLPPARNWDELEHVNMLLDREARHNRLVSEKFNFNGNRDATGGGSHIVIGGATLEDSPILRRPDLLRSMIAFWQNHPSLSYLFSGMYVGPTSQYPRVDEARMDALYELEVAFRHLPTRDCAPYIVDGLFRNLLADVTGNTHRAEFCVDKLFPPDGLGLRLGLLELRAFEMPPNMRMGLLQMLLVRALVCAFWKVPFEGSLTPWGTILHDRFMLPHFVQQDFLEVLAHLRKSDFAFDPEWFASHFEFRFPKIGSIGVDDVEVELRRALEPWNVLAEEAASGRTVRNVDSSVERVQVKLSGLKEDSRYVVACNGRRVPLQPATEPGVAVAGVRFRARKLSATMHPTIPVHSPLTFTLIDLRDGSSIGQCSYRIDPPEGREYKDRPANAAEAEARRLERFVVLDQIVPATIPEDEINPIFPGTLDLRIPPRSASARIETREILS